MKEIEKLLNELENSLRINREIIVAKKEVEIATIQRDQLIKEFKIKEGDELEKLNRNLLRLNGIIKDREENIIDSLTFYEDDKIKEIRNKIIEFNTPKQ